MNITFNETLCIFIADCMCVISKKISKTNAIIEMSKKANLLFYNFPSTPEKVAQVKKVILQMVV